MEDMYMHQHAKVEPNQSTDGAAISANVCTHSPPTHTLFYTLYAFHTCIFIYIYSSILYIWGKQKFTSLQTSPEK